MENFGLCWTNALSNPSGTQDTMKANTSLTEMNFFFVKCWPFEQKFGFEKNCCNENVWFSTNGRQIWILMSTIAEKPMFDFFIAMAIWSVSLSCNDIKFGCVQMREFWIALEGCRNVNCFQIPQVFAASICSLDHSHDTMDFCLCIQNTLLFLTSLHSEGLEIVRWNPMGQSKFTIDWKNDIFGCTQSSDGDVVWHYQWWQEVPAKKRDSHWNNWGMSYKMTAVRSDMHLPHQLHRLAHAF